MAVRSELKICVQSPGRGRVDRHGPDFGALAADPEMRDAPVLVERSDREVGDLVASAAVVEQCGEKCPVARG